MKLNFQYQPGDFSNQSIGRYTEISIVADVVKDDLEELYYSNINVSTVRQSGYDHTIAVRNGNGDYHFMKLSSDNSRYHKPGNSWVLRYNYTPSNSRVWTNEAVQKSGVAMAPTIIYDSTIYYISYDEPHEHEFSYKYEWIDKEYHYSYLNVGLRLKLGMLLQVHQMLTESIIACFVVE